MSLTSHSFTATAILVITCAMLTTARPSGTITGTTLPPFATPVIGVLEQDVSDPAHTPGNQYLMATYVKYLEMAGARVVPIKGYQHEDYYRHMFAAILNGLLLPGGSQDIVTSDFARVSGIFYKLAVEANDKGDYFPIWGTCQGFEQLTELTVGKNVLTRTDTEDLALPLQLAPQWNASRLLTNAPGDVMRALLNENVTANFHDWSLLVDTYNNMPALNTFYRVITTNWDRNRKHNFVSTFEAIKYPFYGVQWHPEMNIFQWHLGFPVKRTPEAIKVTHYFAQFFVDEARKSSHRSASYPTIAAKVVENYKMYYSRGDMSQIYYFFVTLPPHK